MPLDIGVGILLAIGVSHFAAVPLTPFLVAFGVACALFPDIDIVTALFGRWKHRLYTHYPLLYIPIFVLIYLFVPHAYALIFIIGVTYHLLHDTAGTGWGLTWLWPFSTRRFLFFPYERSKEMGTIATWIPEEKPQFEHDPNNTTHASWVHNIYFTVNIVSVVEYGGLILSIVILILYLHY